MSYDVSMCCTHCGSILLDRNHTSNTARMWRAAGCDLTEFDGKTAAELAPVLDKAIHEIDSNRAKYEPMEPPNGWGTLESTLEFLRDVRAACQLDPAAKVEVSW